jgi:outer membrane receptor protein involved in Fe transport
MPGALWQNHIDQYGRRYARYAEDYTKNADDYVVVGLKNQFVATGESLADLSYRRKKTDSFFLSSGNPTLRNSIETFGLTPRHVWQLQLADRDNRLLAGVDLYKSFYRSSQNEYTDDQSVQNYTNVTKSSLAGYIQNELALLDPWSFVTGVRYETARYACNYHD